MICLRSKSWGEVGNRHRQTNRHRPLVGLFASGLAPVCNIPVAIPIALGSHPGTDGALRHCVTDWGMNESISYAIVKRWQKQNQKKKQSEKTNKPRKSKTKTTRKNKLSKQEEMAFEDD